MTQAHANLRTLADAAEKDGQHIYTNPRDSNAWQANEAWHKAAAPEVVIELLNQIEQLEQGKCLHQIAEPAASVEKQIEEVMRKVEFMRGAAQFGSPCELDAARKGVEEKLRTLLSTPQPCSRSHPHEEMTPMCELRTEIARLTNALARAEAAAPQVVQAAVPAVRGEVLVTVSGFTGSGKSAIAGEIEIMCRALGLQVEWPDGATEKNMTHADWTTALELYNPRVRIIERNVPRNTASGADQ